jgi:hypothetical protein
MSDDTITIHDRWWVIHETAIIDALLSVQHGDRTPEEALAVLEEHASPDHDTA